LFYSSCSNNKSNEAPEISLIEKGEVDEIPNDSDFDFEDALNVYDYDDYMAAAEYIRAAMKDL